MKKRYFALAAALLAGGVLVAGLGVGLKLRMPEEYAFLYEEHSPVSLPFALLADGNLVDVLQKGFVAPPEATEPVTTAAVTLPEETTAVTETTAPQTTAPITEVTELPTEPPTEPSTEPPTEAPTVPEETISLEDLYPVIPEAVVDPSYFDDTLFIGDSRACGLRDYARLGDADYFCDVGMTIFNMWERKCYDYDFYSTTLESHLRSEKYGKIYITLGINECGYPLNNFKNEYARMLKRVRELQPDAMIVLNGVINVTSGYARSLPYFQPEHIAAINEYIASLADGEQVYYIDANPVFTGPDGFMMKRITKDGCHFYAKEYVLWAQWFCAFPPVT